MWNTQTIRVLAVVTALCLCGACPEHSRRAAYAGEPGTENPFGDMLALKDGIALPCSIKRITAKGLLEFRTGWTQGTATAHLGGLAGVTMRPAAWKAKDPSCVLLTNGDAITPDKMTFADGVFVLTVLGTEMKCPAERIKRLNLTFENQARPRRHQGDARVRAGGAFLHPQRTRTDRRSPCRAVRVSRRSAHLPQGSALGAVRHLRQVTAEAVGKSGGLRRTAYDQLRSLPR